MQFIYEMLWVSRYLIVLVLYGMIILQYNCYSQFKNGSQQNSLHKTFLRELRALRKEPKSVIKTRYLNDFPRYQLD